MCCDDPKRLRLQFLSTLFFQLRPCSLTLGSFSSESVIQQRAFTQESSSAMYANHWHARRHLSLRLTAIFTRVPVSVLSPEISRASLRVSIPWYMYLYTVPFLSLYPLLAYAYYIKYDEWLKSEEWTFLACVSLGAGHALSFWSRSGVLGQRHG